MPYTVGTNLSVIVWSSAKPFNSISFGIVSMSEADCVMHLLNFRTAMLYVKDIRM